MSHDHVFSDQLTVHAFMDGLVRRNPGQIEFHQAVFEVAAVLVPYINQHPHYVEARILERMTEPDRVIMFRVNWEDDKGRVRVNRGYRVQQSNAIGPYKGGIRFHQSVNLSILKFLAFEQTFKNSLTGLPLGSAKGGSDFNPKGKSDREIMRFCHAFIRHLHQHIGENRDVPAGDIGVGAREIGFMQGRLMELTNRYTATLTGKGLSYGGSLVRTEATGYGCVYFLKAMLEHANNGLEGKRVLISGSGNVAIFAAEKVMQLGGKVLTLSDSSGTLYVKQGMDKETLEYVKQVKFERYGRLSEVAKALSLTYLDGQRPWHLEGEVVLPCATQNELDVDDAKQLVKRGCVAIAEGANMPTTPEAVDIFQQAGVLYAPGKASNAGGVAVSGLEMSQNRMGLSWTHADVDQRLQDIMKHIHTHCLVHGGLPSGDVDYVKGAAIYGFIKVADTLLSYGV